MKTKGMNRRAFLAKSGMSLASLMVHGYAFPKSAFAQTGDSPIFIELQCLVGLDQFNLVHPRSGAAYNALLARRGAAATLDPNTVVPISTGDTVGVHPLLATPLQNAGAWGNFRVLQHMDPAPFHRNSSHRERQRAMALGVERAASNNAGLLARLHSNGVPLVMFGGIGENNNLTCEGQLGCPARPLRFDNLENYNLQAASFATAQGGSDNADHVANVLSQISSITPKRKVSALEMKYREGMASMFNAIAEVEDILTHTSPKYANYHKTSVPYGNLATYNSIAARFRGVATVINHRVTTGNVGPMIFSIGMGGFDVHGNWQSQNAALMHMIGENLGTLVSDLKAMGVWDRTVIFSQTEFGRRVHGNGEGSDHGQGAMVFMLGGKVKKGLFGDVLSANEITSKDNIDYRYDQRAVMISILENHLGVNPHLAFSDSQLERVGNLNTNFDLFAA